MKPISFMRLRNLDSLGDITKKYAPRELIVEQKFDGFKVMAVKTKAGTRLWSRNGKELTRKAPSIVNILNQKMPLDSAVIGEVIYVVDGKQELGHVQSILHSSTSRALSQTKALRGRLEFVLYDVIRWNGEGLSSRKLQERKKILSSSKFSTRGFVRLSKVYPWSKRQDALRHARRSGGEGIVIKLKNSPYKYRQAGRSEPLGEWWKYKTPGEKAHTEDVILLGHERREKRLAFKMYQLNRQGKKIFVGYISNLPRSTEKDIKSKNDKNKPIVAEISYQERFPSGKFRHPGWIRTRPDKPIRSATLPPKYSKMTQVRKNPHDRTVYVAIEKDGAMHLYPFSSKKFLQPSASALQYNLGLRSSTQGGQPYTLDGESELRKFLKANWPTGRVVKGTTRNSNPRNSKVKDALSLEALRYKKFDEFANAYWNACSRGLYWIATNEKNFYIGDYERSQIRAGKFIVSCSPELALSGKNESKKFVAELDVTKVPAKDIVIKRGSTGSEIKILAAAGSIKVARVLDAKQAKRSFKWQLSILPSSKEELRQVWTKAWEKQKREDAKRAIRIRKEKERELKRSIAKEEREQKAKAKRTKKVRAEAARRKAARAAVGAKARKESAAKAAAAASKKKTSKKKGVWKRVPPSEARQNPGNKTRKIPAHVNKPGE